jgi:hypothetical protein
MPRRKSKRLLEHSGTLPFSPGQREIRFERFQPSGSFGPDPRQPGRPNWMRQTAMPPSVADHSSWRSSAAALRWASQQSSGFDWDLGSGAFQPSTQEYDGFYRLKADTGRGSPPGQRRGGPPRKAARPAVYQPSGGAQVASPPILRGSEEELKPSSGPCATGALP